MNGVPELLWPMLSSIAISLFVSLLTSYLATRRWRRERAASVRDDAYKSMTNAAYNWVQAINYSSDSELNGEGVDMTAFDSAHKQLNDSMFMLSKVADPASFERIEHAFEDMRSKALQVDTNDPALTTTGTEAGLRAKQSMKDFVDVVSDEMRKHLGL